MAGWTGPEPDRRSTAPTSARVQPESTLSSISRTGPRRRGQGERTLDVRLLVDGVASGPLLGALVDLADDLQERKAELAGDLFGQVGHEGRMTERRDARHPLRCGLRRPVADHCGRRGDELRVERAVVELAAPGQAAPSAVAPVGERAALLDAFVARDVCSLAGVGVVPLLAGADGDRASAEERLGSCDELDAERPVGRDAGAVVADAAVVGGRVVEQAGDEAHPAAGGVEVVEHRLLLGAPRRRDVVDPLRGVLPRFVGAGVRRPARPLDRAVDVELLDDQLDRADLEVDLLLESEQRQRRTRPFERLDDVVHEVLRRERRLDEVVLDLLVLEAAQEDAGAPVERPAGAPHLLVVGDGRTGRLEVDDEAQVGFVVTHAECGRGDEHLDLVGLELGLGGEPRVGAERPVVGLGSDAVGPQPVGHVLDIADRQAVHDPRPGQFGDGLGEPGEAFGLPVELDGAQREAVAAERPAERGELRAQLIGDVGDDAIVGGRGAAEDRHLRPGEAVDDPTDPPVVGTEVVTPVGDAVDLVDHDQTGPSADDRHDLGGEVGIGESLGRDEDEVDHVAVERLDELVDGGVGGAVDRLAPQPEPGGGVDLIAHQGEER